ncbi:MAG: hypothetical protein JXO22_12675 [Phycisphaerae bacterium]|nr:hypothetical protein [Phycisphaerae bacterium]
MSGNTRFARSSVMAGILALFTLWQIAAASADVRLPAIFSDKMVLQQEADIVLWGWAAPREFIRIKVGWADLKLMAVAGPDGRWSLPVRTPKAGGPYDITYLAKNKVTISDVMIGEVWLCSGQSNMEWSFASGVDNGDQELAQANNPKIRLFQLKNTFNVAPQPDCEGTWLECTPDSVRSFSAIGYLFGNELHRELNVPIGLIDATWGGTVAESWTSTEGLRGLGDFNDTLDQLAQERKQPGTLDADYNRAVADWWTNLDSADPGSGADGWMKAELDDAAWTEVTVPGAWETQGLDGFDGTVWFRRSVTLPEDWAGIELVVELGSIDDMDTTWFNGVKIGGTEQPGYWNMPRKYNVPPAAVHGGANVIAIRVLDTLGAGGLTGAAPDLRLYPAGIGPEVAISLAGNWRYHVGAPLDKLPAWPQGSKLHVNLPTVLFNGMINPLVPYGIRGVIWYQGESNRPRAAQYRKLFPAMIQDWRSKWPPTMEKFAFYYVQIAPFAYGDDTGQAGELRDAQRMAMSTPLTGMAVTLDIGNPRDIHPRNKQDVGHRLALWALAKTYGRENLICSGPLYKELKIEDGNVRVLFDHAGGGLVATGKLEHFEIAGADGKFVPAEARIDGETLVLSSADVKEPTDVRYAWGATDESCLANKAGLPASSFSSQHWWEKKGE